MQINARTLWLDLERIKEQRPLIHNITNYVVMEQTANSLLAVGACPVMAHAFEEVQEMSSSANSLVINIGTLSPLWVNAMELAIRSASALKIPIVLDPAGAGATAFRTDTAKLLLRKGGISTIKGNASEIASLITDDRTTRGVDSTFHTVDCIRQAQSLATHYECVVFMSGKVDIITNGKTTFEVRNGDPLMTRITGMGCTATALTGAFLAVNECPLKASVHAAIFIGIIGEIAAKKVSGPGMFKPVFIDTIYTISLDEIEKHIRLGCP